jgi:hypothetical protein
VKRIEVHPIDNAEGYFLVGDNESSPVAGRGFITDISPSFDALLELVPLSQSESPKAFDRDNESTGISVRVDYGFATEQDRDKFIIDLQSNVPRLGNVFIGMTGSAWWIPRAKCRPITANCIGDVACIVNYTFEGPKMQRNKPA